MNFDSDRLDVDNSDVKYKKHKDGMGDEEINTYEENKVAAAADHIPNWPKSVYAYLKFGYDNTFAYQIWRKQKTTFKKWIDSVMTHVQTYYRHKSLPTKIEFKVIILLRILYLYKRNNNFGRIIKIILSIIFSF